MWAWRERNVRLVSWSMMTVDEKKKYNFLMTETASQHVSTSKLSCTINRSLTDMWTNGAIGFTNGSVGVIGWWYFQGSMVTNGTIGRTPNAAYITIHSTFTFHCENGNIVKTEIECGSKRYLEGKIYILIKQSSLKIYMSYIPNLISPMWIWLYFPILSGVHKFSWRV